jgi:hypothetical protein
VKATTVRTQLWFVGLGYAAVVLVSAGLLIGRYIMERIHASEVTAAGGMYGFGDLILYIFVICLFMIPTFFLVWVMARVEGWYTRYAQLLVGISLSAPVSLGLSALGQNHVGEILSNLCFVRLAFAPFILVVIGVSRIVARFNLAKKLTVYALLIEGLTMAAWIVLLIRR